MTDPQVAALEEAASGGIEPHVYLSTGCLHGHHDYCQGKTGKAGAKVPAQCKFCDAACRCRCHTDSTLTEPASTPEPEHCIHSKNIHQQHHQAPVAGCPWCPDGKESQ